MAASEPSIGVTRSSRPNMTSVGALILVSIATASTAPNARPLRIPSSIARLYSFLMSAGAAGSVADCHRISTNSSVRMAVS